MRPIQPILNKQTQHPAVRFGKMSAATELFIADSAGVLGPKLVTTRSAQQAVESITTEGLEDVAFYLMVPFGSRFAFAPLFSWLHGLSQKDVSQHVVTNNKLPKWLSFLPQKIQASLSSRTTQSIGVSLTEHLNGQDVVSWLNKPGAKNLVAAKAATILSVLSLALASEFILQHTSFAFSQKLFKNGNFNKVAALEKNAPSLEVGQAEPVAKFKNRAKWVGGLTLASLAFAATFPALIRNSNGLAKATAQLLKFFDFRKGTGFDLSKALFLPIPLIGLAGYFDAGRNPNQKKEDVSRLALVIPYLLFGKDLFNNVVAKVLEYLPVHTAQGWQRAKSIAPNLYTDKALFQSISPLDLGITKSKEAVEATLKQVSHLEPNTFKSLLGRYKWINWASYAFMFGVMGVALNLITYHFTRQRHQQEVQAKAIHHAAGVQAKTVSSKVNHALAAPAVAFQSHPVQFPNPVIRFPNQNPWAVVSPSTRAYVI